MTNVSRRDLLRAGVAGAAAATTWTVSGQEISAPPVVGSDAPGTAPQSQPQNPNTLLFFNADEARFVEAAIDRLIPADETWAGAKDAGVLYYIDHQLAGAYGAGARMYLAGPWDPEASPGQGYQLKHTPAELYRSSIAEIRDALKQDGGKELWELDAGAADAALKRIESGELKLATLPSAVFFETLLANTVEGYFADPIYGGNRDMVGWRMIGFPGAYAQFVDLVDQHGYVFDRPPIGIGHAQDTPMVMQMEKP